MEYADSQQSRSVVSLQPISLHVVPSEQSLRLQSHQSAFEEELIQYLNDINLNQDEDYLDQLQVKPECTRSVCLQRPDLRQIQLDSQNRIKAEVTPSGPRAESPEGKEVKKPATASSRKNILRNMTALLKTYLKHNNKCELVLLESMGPDKLKDLRSWTERQMQITTLQDFRDFWSRKDEYMEVLRKVCLRFYEEEGPCAVLLSKVSSQKKQEYLANLYKFVEGIRNPRSFRSFK